MGEAGVIIVGGGQGGAQVAISLRDEGFRGPLRIIGDEPGLPYQRPPLSKAYLTGRTDREALNLRSAAFYAERDITLSRGRVEGIERDRCHVLLEGGATLAYDHLVLATGARNRPLPVPGADLDGVFQLRTVEDTDRLRARMTAARSAVVIGAGFIGLEFAAVAAAAGLAVTVLEATVRPMSRVVSAPMSTFFEGVHAALGVRLISGASVVRVGGASGHVCAVETADGLTVPADLVVVGIGVLPNVELAAQAGLPVENGVVVDALLATPDRWISAIGDCAAFPQPFADGLRGRLESVQNAVDQARTVAARLAGQTRPYEAVPWFWSDQGPYKLQIAGCAEPGDSAVLRGDAASGAFSVFRFRGERLTSVESVNRAGDHMVARKLLAARTPLTLEEAADPATDLRTRLRA